MELIIVIVIISVVVGVALPSSNWAFLRTQLSAIIRDITETFVYAHQCAVSEGVSYRVNFDLENQRYWLSQGDKSLTSLEFRTLGSDVTITELILPQNEKMNISQKYVTFRPNGTADECLLYLRDKKGNIYTIVTIKTTGQVKTFNYRYEKR